MVEGSIIGLPPDSLEVIMEKRLDRKLRGILFNEDQSLFGVFGEELV